MGTESWKRALGVTGLCAAVLAVAACNPVEDDTCRFDAQCTAPSGLNVQAYCKITSAPNVQPPEGICATRSPPVTGPPTPGSLRLSWTVDGAPAATECAASGVDTVSVSLAGDPTVLRSFPCADGQGVIPEINEGSYTIVETAMRSDGHCFSNLSGTCVAASQAVTITSGMPSTLTTVDLVVVGEVATSWTLDGLVPDSRVCAALHAATVHLSLGSGAGPPLTQDVPCANGGGGFGHVATFDTYTVHADLVRSDGSIAQSLSSSSFFLNPGQSVVTSTLPFVFNESSIGTAHVTWTVNGVAPTPSSPGPCISIDAEHVVLSYPDDNASPRCDAGEAFLTAVVPQDSVLLALLENGSNASLTSISTPFHPRGGTTTEIALAFVTTHTPCDVRPCTVSLGGAVTDPQTCTWGFARPDPLNPSQTAFMLTVRTPTGVVSSIGMNLNFVGPPQVGSPTLVGDQVFGITADLSTTDRREFTAAVGARPKGASTLNITTADPRVGGTPGDWCLHGTFDATLAPGGPFTPPGPWGNVSLHADF